MGGYDLPVSPRDQQLPPKAQVKALLAAGQARKLAKEDFDERTAELKPLVVAAIRAGGSYRTVAKLAGITNASVQSWVNEANA